MKRVFTILLCCWLFIPALRAQQTASLLDAADLKAANDSILAEAYQLYLHEKVAWVLEDVFYGSKSSAINMVDGWLPITEDGITVKGIFYNKEKTQALFEANFNIQTGETSAKDAVRDLTKEEIDEINEHLRIIDAVKSLDAEDLPYCPEGCTFNVDAVSIGENLHRVYYILGTSQHGIIPFGCDFSYDCDSEGNIKAFRRYHKTYIPAVLKMEDGSAVREIFHSHLSICPLMAPTDIALFLLYGYEAGLSGFNVLSTVYHCLFAFDPETYEIKVEQMAN